MARRAGITISRDDLLDAALLKFAQLGFEGTKVGGIAEQAGITPGALYFHFKSKEDLFLSLVEREFAKTVISPPAANLSLREMLVYAGRQLVDMFRSNPPFTKIIFIEGIKNPQIAAPFYRQLLRQTGILEAELRRHFRIAENDGSAILHYASRFFLGAVGWAEMALDLFGGRQQEQVEDSQMIELYVDIFLKGLEGIVPPSSP
ncbi:TetR/AcrR family transcriptional regulator [Paenibacillus sp. MER 180]|uniref:TetR/AcrR family transcriptional regulator n=1 Tax=unclassified Paenibacillus TaxID=185978 RepID=UPI0008066108|nr:MULTISPECIES: TetR/AcrR family transcriptional regulator [unclassified Paenibacillus]MCM3290569.1 TetR/AcrR family transcriptional regulator [Paenibacillus sp. MER 180]OBY77144.1 hypothetical protein BBG47_23360 [Paenibacillus sp. KS1]